MLEMQLRQAATVLLESAIRIAPPDARDWGRAMMGELNYVKSPWEGTLWALGSSSVLAKQALVSLIVPGRGQNYVPDGGLFAKNATLRRAALAMAGACIVVALLFFAAPPFRQAFEVAMKPWHLASGAIQPRFEALARQAEARHDPEGLAFCAMRIDDPGKSARLADEAVNLDPNFLWVYAVVAMRHPELGATDGMAKLERQDPQNALFPLIMAESIRQENGPRGIGAPLTPEQEQRWQSAMAAAFHASEFDDYLDRVDRINRRVVPRYEFYDPYEVQSREQVDLPASAFANSQQFASLILRSGWNLEASGNQESGRDKYWTVVKFGQMIDSRGRTDREHRMGTILQAAAYSVLKVSSQKQGNQRDVALYSYLAEKFEFGMGNPPRFPSESAFGRNTSERNAAVVEISGIMILLFSGLAVIALAILIVGARRRAGPAAKRARPVATIVAFTSAAGLLFSSVTLYLTYRPYWYIFQSAIQNGDGMQTRDMQEFLNSTQMLPGFSHRVPVLLEALLYSGSPSFLFYVWVGVTLLGVIGLVLIFLRRVLGHPHIHAP